MIRRFILVAGLGAVLLATVYYARTATAHRIVDSSDGGALEYGLTVD